MNIENIKDENSRRVVYRVCNSVEVDKILSNGDFAKIGNIYNFFNFPKVNNHRYEEKQPYLHFFKELDSISYLKELKGNYLCIYNIPMEILNRYKGIGYYRDLMDDYDFYELEEYAIKSKELLFEYLENILYINREIDFYFLSDNNLKNFTEIIYDIKKPFVKTLRK